IPPSEKPALFVILRPALRKPVSKSPPRPIELRLYGRHALAENLSRFASIPFLDITHHEHVLLILGQLGQRRANIRMQLDMTDALAGLIDRVGGYGQQPRLPQL